MDANNNAFWIREYHGNPTLFMWLKWAKKWVTSAPLNLDKVELYRKSALIDSYANAYHNQHKKSTGIDPLSF